MKHTCCFFYDRNQNKTDKSIANVSLLHHEGDFEDKENGDERNACKRDDEGHNALGQGELGFGKLLVAVLVV